MLWNRDRGGGVPIMNVLNGTKVLHSVLYEFHRNKKSRRVTMGVRKHSHLRTRGSSFSPKAKVTSRGLYRLDRFHPSLDPQDPTGLWAVQAGRFHRSRPSGSRSGVGCTGWMAPSELTSGSRSSAVSVSVGQAGVLSGPGPWPRCRDHTRH